MKILLKYIWIGGNNEIRTKIKVYSSNGLLQYCNNELVNEKMISIKIPDWNFDGSSTGQADSSDSEVILKPIKIYKDPFQTRLDSYLVLCETYTLNNVEHETNTRKIARNIFNTKNISYYKPLFGIEHEFFIMKKSKDIYGNNILDYKPIGFEHNPTKQGQYYCSVGYENCSGQTFLDEILELCLKAGLNVTGSNMEVCPGQAEIQICAQDIQAADDSVILKYILHRLGELYHYKIDFSAKPIKGDWNGSGCHVNFSTIQMRSNKGINVIYQAIEKLKLKHSEHIKIYGDDNVDRLTGKHETSDINTFSYGIADRSASIRIPKNTIEDEKGYFEDRRPSSSADMYLVTSKIFHTCIN